MADFELRFGDPVSIERKRKAGRVDRHAKMLVMYGPGPEGARCADCVHFLRLQYANTYFKCRKSGITSGAATDWRARWSACGAFQKAVV